MTRPDTKFHALLITILLGLSLSNCGGGGGGEGDDDDEVPADDDDDDAICPPGTLAEADGAICVLSGTLTESITLTPDRDWLLSGGVFIGEDRGREMTLSVEPGTHVFGEVGTNSFLCVNRGSRLVANGTREAPIVFTSSKDPGSRTRGDWGGIILNGRAKLNSCPLGVACERLGEGGTGYYGGLDDEDDSGVLRYVRIEFAGREISPDNQLNALSLQGTGAGTVLDHIQIHKAADDAIEFYGGTVSFKHILATGPVDDLMDWVNGWRGKGQFFIGQQHPDAGDNGIEGDNFAEENDSLPRSEPVLSNITLIGSPDSVFSGNGVWLREATGGHLSNMAVLGFATACMDMDDPATFSSAVSNGELTGSLTLERTYLDCAVNLVDEPSEAGFAATLPEFFNVLNEGNRLADPLLTDPFNLEQPGFLPQPDSPLLGSGAAPSDSFFDPVNFIGGIGPDDNWIEGWTSFDAD